MEIRVPKERIQYLFSQLDQSRHYGVLESLAMSVSDTEKATLPFDLTKIFELVSTVKALSNGELSEQAKALGVKVTDDEVIADESVLLNLMQYVKADLAPQEKTVHHRSWRRRSRRDRS